MQPHNAIERELVYQAARLSLAIDRGERIETAHLTRRVRKAEQVRAQRPGAAAQAGSRARPQAAVHRRARRGQGGAGWRAGPTTRNCWSGRARRIRRGLPLAAPAVGGIPQPAADRKLKWEGAELLRFIRLQGKNVVESVYDPVFNSIFLAWDVLVEKYAQQQWHYFQEVKPRTDPAFNHRLLSRRLLPDPATRPRLGQHLRDRRRARRAAGGAAGGQRGQRSRSGPGLGRPRGVRRQSGVRAAPALQSAKTRELHRTLDALRKMRDAEFGTGNEEEEMANGECTMAEEQCEVEASGCDQGQTGELTSAGCSGPIVGQDSNLVSDDSTNDAMGISSYVGTDAADGACLGDGLEQSLACGVKTLEKAPNEPNLESMQSVFSQRVEPENAEPAGRERSQSAAGEHVVHDAGDEAG